MGRRWSPSQSRFLAGRALAISSELGMGPLMEQVPSRRRYRGLAQEVVDTWASDSGLQTLQFPVPAPSSLPLPAAISCASEYVENGPPLASAASATTLASPTKVTFTRMYPDVVAARVLKYPIIACRFPIQEGLFWLLRPELPNGQHHAAQ